MLIFKEALFSAQPGGTVTIVCVEDSGVHKGTQKNAYVEEADLLTRIQAASPTAANWGNEECRAAAEAYFRHQFGDETITVGLPPAPVADPAA